MGQDRHMQMLGPVDTAFWSADTPETPMNIGAVLIFEGKIEFEKLVRLIASRIHQAPLYQQHVVNAPWNLGEPTWVFDPNFDIRNHMFNLTLEAPGTEEQLRQMAGRVISSMLDRSKPLWEIYQIDGLADDRTAIMLKVHHAMVDGLSAVELFIIMMEFSPEEPEIGQPLPYNPPPSPSTFRMMTETVATGLPHRWNLLKQMGREAFELQSVLWNRKQRKKLLYGLTNFINDNLPPIKPLLINGRNTGRIEMAWAQFALEDIKAIRHGRHASINDVMMTILGSAIGKYIDAHGGIDPEQEFVRVLMPVNLRTEDRKEDNVGNRIAMLPVDIPFITKNAYEALQEVADYSKVMKESHLSSAVDILLSAPSLAPALVQPFIWNLVPKGLARIAHTWCTNVPGPPMPIYLMGHEMKQFAGYFPLNPAMGMAAVILSYNGSISINIVADAAIVTNITEMRDYMVATFDELMQSVDRYPGKLQSHIQDERPPRTVNTQSRKPQPASENGQVKEAVAERVKVTVEGVSASTNGASAKSSEGQLKLLSPGWAVALKDVINNSKAYRDASKRWTAGSLAMVMHASAANGYPEASAVVLDLHKGVCNGAKSVTPEQAHTEANFVLEGSYAHWMDVLEGRSQPLPMITRGQLKLTKGALFRLVPHTRSAEELVKCAMQVK